MAAKTSAFGGAGTTFGYKASGGPSFTTLAQVIDIEAGGVEVDEIDTTLLSSAAKTSIPSIPDPGDYTLTIFYVMGDPGVAAIRGLINAGTVETFQIMYADGSTATSGTTEVFTGYIKSFAPKGMKIGEAVTAEVTVRASGLIAVTPAT